MGLSLALLVYGDCEIPSQENFGAGHHGSTEFMITVESVESVVPFLEYTVTLQSNNLIPARESSSNLDNI